MRSTYHIEEDLFAPGTFDEVWALIREQGSALRSRSISTSKRCVTDTIIMKLQPKLKKKDFTCCEMSSVNSGTDGGIRVQVRM